ncbi:MAG: protein kinase, partial [Kiloniellaceae bacterium]
MLGSKVESLASRFKKSPAVQDAGAGFVMARGDFAGAGRLAEQGLKHAGPGGDPKLTSRLLVKRGTSRWVAGDMAGACSDGETAYGLDEANFGAFELKMYSCGRAPRGEGSAKREKTQRLVSLQDDSIPHTHEEWALRQERRPTASGRLSLKAMKAHREGDLGAALSHAEGAVEADPEDPMAWFQRGYIRGGLNDHDGAILDLTRAIRMGWKDKVLFKLRGAALMSAGRHQAAFSDANMAVALSPGYAVAYYLRATARMALEMPAAGILADMKKAAELDPAMRGDYLAALEKLGPGERRGAQPSEGTGARRSGRPAPGAAGPGADDGLREARKSAPRRPARRDADVLLALVLGLAVLGLIAALFLLGRSRARDAAPRISSAPEPPPPPRAAEPLLANRYAEGSMLGRGGMGIVYRGTDKNLDRPVAIKVPNDSLQRSPRHSALMEKEGRIHLELGAHPNIVSLLDVVRDRGMIHLILEFVTGRTLEQVLAGTPGRRLPLDAALRIVKDVCAALDHAHARRVIHRDLKPSNVMLVDGDGIV